MHLKPSTIRKSTLPASRQAPWVFLLLLLLTACQFSNAEPLKNYDHLSTEQLEARRAEIDETLVTLPEFTVRSGVGSIGYRSHTNGDLSDSSQFVQINLEKPSLIDQVVLVPELWRGFDPGIRADGFPIEFQIRCGKDDDSEGKVVARRGPEDQLLPRIAPVVVDIPLTMASWVRIEALQLSPRSFDGKGTLQLAEVYLFSGQKNVAYQQEVSARTSENNADLHTARHRKNLVDGFTPLIMDVNQGERSVAFLSQVQIGSQPSITFDLKEIRAVDQINFHTVEVSDSIPQALPNDFAVPERMVVEASRTPGFENPSFLTRYIRRSLFDTGAIICRQFPSTQARYVRITFEEPYYSNRGGFSMAEIGFAEIEILSKGINIAIGKPISIEYHDHHQGRRLDALNDGRNIYGNILPVRTWLEKLALRHDLEYERPRIAAELEARYEIQNENFRTLQWGIAALTAGSIIITLLSRISRQRAVHNTRQRIAADLHDELGANLHALGLLSDLAQKNQHNESKLTRLLIRIGNLTRRSGKAARYCTDMLEAKELYRNVPEQIERCSRRFLSDMNYSVDIEGAEFLEKLSPRQRIDLCLFHKECLANILRHAEASDVSTVLLATEHSVQITVTDNGLGLASDEIPKSILRRSRLLGSQVRSEIPIDGGTRIILTLKLKKFGLI